MSPLRQQIDYYRILGVTPAADESDIRRAYRRKAKAVHPDVQSHTAANEAFQLINEAYHTLIDPEKRRMYDIRMKYVGWYDAEINRQSKKYGTYRQYARRHGATSTNPNNQKVQNGLSGKTLRIFNRVLFYSIVVIVGSGIIFGLLDLLVNGAYLGIIFFLVIFLILLSGKRFLSLGKQKEDDVA
jgi:hypothetical protein